ncbi:MAG TPA: alpha/beta fold hydrolase [Bacteroidales bacterium]|nr:alpha/beta fold hydrolase [Bacteroidales bacterium]
MKNFILFFLIVLCTSFSTYSQNKLPYPIIFIHGLAGSESTFGTSMEFLRDNYQLGEINVFDVVLNADNNLETAQMENDVKWENFIYNDDFIYVGRRNYTDDMDDYVQGWTESSIFAINFKEENIKGANGTFNDYFDQSNQSAIYKQGYALNKMIQEVLAFTGADKVILVGHSMGGLCIREYLQRTNENSVHVNWIDPTVEDGHKVARVATFGTPHLGSNTSPDPTKSDIPDEQGKSEANRDMLWEYDSYNFCETYPQGIYLFGGNENCIASESGVFGNATFDNVDINCNGSQTDDIIGINEGPDSQSYNLEMPLPLNIKFTYMTSIWIGWDIGLIGDGAVDINKQWLYDQNRNPVPLGIADTLLTDVFHTNEGNDYYTLIRGLDEPSQFSLAYILEPDDEIIGLVTFQQNGLEIDEDMYKLKCGDNHTIEFIYNGESSNVNTIQFYDLNENLTLSKTITNSVDTTIINIPVNDDGIYVKLIGTATSTSWENPYKTHFTPVETTEIENDNNTSASIFPNPSNGICRFSLINIANCYIKIFNTDGDEVFHSEITNLEELDLSSLPNGIYTIKFDFDSGSLIQKLVIIR